MTIFEITGHQREIEVVSIDSWDFKVSRMPKIVKMIKEDWSCDD